MQCVGVVLWAERVWPSDRETWGHKMGAHPYVAHVGVFLGVDRPGDRWEVVVCTDGSSLWREIGSERWRAYPPADPAMDALPRPGRMVFAVHPTKWMRGHAARHRQGD